MQQPAVGGVPQRRGADSFAPFAVQSHPLRHAASLAFEAAIIAALILLLFLRVPEVTGRSMEPQLASGDHVLINTLAFDIRIGPLRIAHLRDMQRGEVIAFVHDAAGQHEVYLKRIIGLPGDTVAFRDGTVLVDGAALAEPYARLRDGSTLAPALVGPNQIYVLGDNRADSDDSRTFGPIAVSAVIGRAALICWPPGRVERIR